MSDFSEIYGGHSAAVYRFALGLSGDRDDADDLTAEAFARAWSATVEIRPGTVRSYLFAVVRNLFLQRQRKSRRHIELQQDSLRLSDVLTPTPGQEHEMKTLELTRKLMRQRSTLVGIAAFLTALPFLFVFDDNGLRWFTLRDAPGLSIAFLVAAAIAWYGYVRIDSRIRP